MVLGWEVAGSAMHYYLEHYLKTPIGLEVGFEADKLDIQALESFSAKAPW